MGPSAAVNAVFYNQLQAIEDEASARRQAAELMDEYAEDVDLLHLASELVIDAIVQPEDLRSELVRRFARYAAPAARVAGEAQRDPAGLSVPFSGVRRARRSQSTWLCLRMIMCSIRCSSASEPRLLAGVRDDGVQGGDRLVLAGDQRDRRPRTGRSVQRRGLDLAWSGRRRAP